MAVVAAVAFDDDVAFGGAACEPEGGHDGFGAGVDESGHGEVGHGVSDGGGELGFGLATAAVAGAFVDLFGDGGADGGWAVAGDEWAVGHDVVDVGIAIDIGEASAFGFLDEDGGGSDGFKGADGRGDSAGHVGECVGEELFGLGVAGLGFGDFGHGG